MDGGDHRQAAPDPQEGRGQGLVVVHDVETAALARQKTVEPPPECIELTKGTGIVGQPFRQVGPGGEVLRAQGQEGVVFGKQVQRGQFDQIDIRVEFGIGRTGCHGNRMSQRLERGRQFTHIDALSADMRVRAVAGHQNAQRTKRGRTLFLFRPCGNKGIWAHDA